MQAAEPSGGPEPRRSLRPSQLRDLCVGLFGVQIVWGLQNVNTSRIFQTLGADAAQLPLLWIAAPITGLLVQPVVGHLSDRHRGRWGRRRPFIVAGTALTVAGMIGMASATSLTGAVLSLWLLMAAVNVAMQPFRSLAADLIPVEQRTRGFAMQACFIGAGAVLASALPWILVNWFGVDGTAPPGELPPSIQLAFVAGASLLVSAVGWTLWRTREQEVTPVPPRPAARLPKQKPTAPPSRGPAWLVGGIAITAAASVTGLRRETYLLAVMLAGYGALLMIVRHRRHSGRPVAGILEIVEDVSALPPAIGKLAVTQFLTWFALFTTWIYSVPAVAMRQFGTIDPTSRAYAAAGDWVGILFATYDGVAVAASLLLPLAFRRWGMRRGHGACLAIGAVGLAGFLVVHDAAMLLVPAIAVGIAWASILSVPYVVVADTVPPGKVGVYMGIHNVFLVLPQLVAAASLGLVLDHAFGGRAVGMLGIAAVAMAGAALSTRFWPDAPDGLHATR